MTLNRFNKLDRVRAPEGTSWDERHPIEYIKTDELEQIYEVQIAQENIWDDTPEVFIVYKGKDGFGFFHEDPGGYSEYTYDPEVMRHYYHNCDWNWFINLGLTDNQRDLLKGFKP